MKNKIKDFFKCVVVDKLNQNIFLLIISYIIDYYFLKVDNLLSTMLYTALWFFILDVLFYGVDKYVIYKTNKITKDEEQD